MFSHESRIKKQYGISSAQYKEMLAAQGGKCAICSSEKQSDKRHKNFDIDHCHKTGVVRGLLCRNCNLMLGYLEMLTKPGVLNSVRKYLNVHLEYKEVS